MTEKINKKWVLNKRPEGMPEDDCWKLEEVPVPEIEEENILIKTLYSVSYTHLTLPTICSV